MSWLLTVTNYEKILKILLLKKKIPVEIVYLIISNSDFAVFTLGKEKSCKILSRLWWSNNDVIPLHDSL